MFAWSPLPVQNVLLKRQVTGRGVLDCMLYPQYAFILASSLWHGKRGQTRAWGWLFFFVKQGNQPRSNWVIKDVTEEYFFVHTGTVDLSTACMHGLCRAVHRTYNIVSFCVCGGGAQ